MSVASGNGAVQSRVPSSLVRRCAAALALTASLAACSTTGRSFDTSEMSRIIPGQTTLEQASAVLKAEPENIYRQRDGAAMARWAYKATALTDAVYFRRELWLQFDREGRFERVANRINVIAEAGQAPDASQQGTSPQSVSEVQGLPHTVPAGFPYGNDDFYGPRAIYPVR